MCLDRQSQTLEKEKKDERTDKLCVETVDLYWCLELGTDWNIRFRFGCMDFRGRHIGQQYRIQHYRYCSADLVGLDFHRPTNAQRPIIVRISMVFMSFCAPNPPGRFFIACAPTRRQQFFYRRVSCSSCPARVETGRAFRVRNRLALRRP